MLTTADLLAAAKNAQGIPSNYRLARVLDVPETTVMRWNTGRNRPDDEMTRRLAEMAGIDPGFAVASVRAEREKEGPMRDLWAGIASRLQGGAVAAGLAAVTLGGWTGGPDGGAHAHTLTGNSGGSVYLMSNAVRRWLRAVAARIGSPVLGMASHAAA